MNVVGLLSFSYWWCYDVYQKRMIKTFCEFSGPRRGLRGAQKLQQWLVPSVSKSITTSYFFLLCDMMIQSMVENVYYLKILNLIQVLNFLQSFASTQSVFQLHFQLEIRGMNFLFKNEFCLQFYN